MNIDLAQIHGPAFTQAELPIHQELGKLDQVAEIISQRVRRHVAFIAQMVDVALDEFFHSTLSKFTTEYHAYAENEIIPASVYMKTRVSPG